MTRTFLALELPDAVRNTLRRYIERLARMIPEVHWADPAGLHTTLAFLGELDDERLDAASQAAATVADVHAPFSLRLAGLGTFGSAHSPRVIWVGLAGENARLLALQAAVADELAARGFSREARPFSPHLTLARIKKPLTDNALAALARVQREPSPDATWQAAAISVMKSELLRPAARYTAVSRWPLGLPA
ncbi:MAG TPA: RNA 2',3'-cyclic phosphodiesterase [Ktedonobacterales bacterium]|nr:RNA 2',3'-cyclic phosphodiesterase [Ktedonobacterales bacterium]